MMHIRGVRCVVGLWRPGHFGCPLSQMSELFINDIKEEIISVASN